MALDPNFAHPSFYGRYYKFLSKQHVTCVLNGNLRLGGFDTYSLLEIVTGDKWIGDREESRVISTLDHLSDLSRNLLVENCNLVSFSYGYCLSLSRGGLGRLSSCMAHSQSPYRYDGCIKITNMQELVTRIGRAFDRRFPKKFRMMGFEGKPVVYGHGNGTRKARNFQDHISHDPFSKPVRYRDQAEFRIAVTMNPEQQTQNFFQLEVSDIRDIAHEVHIADVAMPEVTTWMLNVDEAIDVIRLALSGIENLAGSASQLRRDGIESLIFADGSLRLNPLIECRHPELDRSIILYDSEKTNRSFSTLGFSMHGEAIIRYLNQHVDAIAVAAAKSPGI